MAKLRAIWPHTEIKSQTLECPRRLSGVPFKSYHTRSIEGPIVLAYATQSSCGEKLLVLFKRDAGEGSGACLLKLLAAVHEVFGQARVQPNKLPPSPLPLVPKLLTSLKLP